MKQDTTTTIQELKEEIKLFSEARDWDQFHSPKELAIGIITEASELLEHFRFLTKEQEESKIQNVVKRDEIGSELADILMFLTRFAQKYDFDLVSEFRKKMADNDVRYSVEKIKGKNCKHTEL